MQIQYQLTQDEFIAAMRIAIRKLTTHGKVQIITFVLMGFLFLYLSFSILVAFSRCVPLFSMEYFELLLHNYRIFVVIGFLIIAVSFLINAYRFPNYHMKKWVKKPVNQAVFENTNIVLNEHSIHFISNTGSESKIVWQQLGRTIQVKHFFLLEIRENDFLIIPKTKMSDAQIHYIDNAFLQYASHYQQKSY